VTVAGILGKGSKQYIILQKKRKKNRQLEGSHRVRTHAILLLTLTYHNRKPYHL